MNPAMKIINGKQCVRLIDLAHAWDTTTSNILCTSKPYHIPGKYLHRIDGRVWCELEGLRYRSTATKKSRLTRHIGEFLNSLGKPAEPEPEPTETETQAMDLGTASLIADAHQLAADSFLKSSDNSEKLRELDDTAFETGRLANENRVRLDNLEATVSKLKGRAHVAQSASTTVVSDKNAGLIQELSGKLDNLADAVHDNLGKTTDNAAAVHVVKQTADTALDTATQAADLARENADIVRSEIERLTKQKERIDALEKHNTVVEALLATSILVGTVGIGGVVGCLMKILH